ncbi:UDP-N-acetylmuramoylalanine--D-glutamate ligase [Owenweeksia hongkongensis DSM 17368]|uniref:UDP-N-acetylmuramoylalanine--D-glutamate ligase n=1 Tax=Owenweeksia hongkongensis (strain DSM 17368 / CIP 108786 / JCM 12287 / NRRL B-23963 / UST20020801) TaxID=926562 RepID=G8R0Q9_OWEHD|nr:UDP-N-acetylmuramoyl-L-alanine--D-glutamate ligase [Owenweeksia hongkongensis]AEV33786.1 UDP-N-acetylmuramoylalanine--D-glutamate ligase [Owenweeksia hongkongensis DSM 17368]
MSIATKISILGAGESGIGAAILAQKQGFNVWVSDGGKIKQKYKDTLNDLDLPYEEGSHNMNEILSSQLVVKSPGIPEKAAVMKAIREAGIEVISEIEFGYRYCKGKIIAITGSNGKTTTTLLTYDILKKAGVSVALGGNVGNSFAASVAESDHDYYVLEISSFQLDDINSFKPHIAILCNITPDHLDRYDYKMENYAASKFAITKYQDETDFFIYNKDDAETLKYMPQHTIKSKPLAITLQNENTEGAWLDETNTIHITINNQEQMNINELALQGKHNTYNSMASGLASKLLGIRKEAIRESLAGFESIEHRLEPVLQVYGMQFINDSKATNVNSTWYALDNMHEPTIWIAGGVDKGNDYSQLFGLVEKKVKAIICLGVDNSKLHQEFEGKVDLIIDAADMDEAVRMAYKMGEKGDNILLSPACASFDLFENYEDRGRQFKAAVRNL